MSTTAGVDRPFGPPPQFPAPDDRAPASALDLAQAADYLERITKALEKQVRHEHVPWDRAYPIPSCLQRAPTKRRFRRFGAALDL